MSWPVFVLLYAAAMAVACFLGRRLWRHRPGALLRTLALGALLLLLADGLAEERGLWVIPRPSGLHILAAPAENLLVVLAAIVNSLLPYLYLKKRL